ncbi:MAG: hypothetical protein KKD28_05985 [Chloroflexi bacterium]|nr:hypothetical protein [Chloroflexota bacterium]MBU1661005.1 hypothetical protein [Chloroflexota bacterium]
MKIIEIDNLPDYLLEKINVFIKNLYLRRTGTVSVQIRLISVTLAPAVKVQVSAFYFRSFFSNCQVAK